MTEKISILSATVENVELEKATGVLRDAGIEPTSIYTVEGGAEALGKENGALTTDRTEENIDWKYVAGKDAVDKVGDKDVQFLDVRDDDTYKSRSSERNTSVQPEGI